MNKLQEKILEVFFVVKQICDHHNLRYWAASGTCLGAVRHKGFIPWDDDLDIIMPDEDYLKFLEIAPKELPEPFELITECESKQSICLFAKVHNVETTLIEPHEVECPDSYKGVFVDIFPVSGTPNHKLARTVHLAKITFIALANRKQRRPIGDAKRLRGKILWLALKPLNVLLPYGYWVKKWKRTAFQYRFDESDYAVGIYWSQAAFSLVFCTEWFHKLVEVPFESTTIKIPQGWDEYLTVLFGDYMKLPPESARKPKHSSEGIIDLEKPYRYYLNHVKEKLDGKG